MPSISGISHQIASTEPPESVHRLEALRVIRRSLNTKRCDLEDTISKCGRSLWSPIATSTESLSLSSTDSSTHSSSTSARSAYPPRSLSLEHVASRFCSTPCPWKNESFQRPPDDAESTAKTPLSTLPPHKVFVPSADSRSRTLHAAQKHNTAEESNEVAPLSPNHSRSRTRSQPSTVTPHYYPSAMAKKLNEYQETILGLAIVELEIEMVYLREYNLGQARKYDETRTIKRATDRRNREEGQLVQFQQVEKASTWPRTLEETGNFF